jgi:hypothetical protein
VVDLKNRIEKPTNVGYRDILVNVKLSNGTTAEVQIIPEAMERAKSKFHKYYEDERSLEAIMKERSLTEDEIRRYTDAILKQVEGYTKAWAETQ